ncbi:HipA domain-containing protein [Sorangium sp. So ce327]|jgi:serine/threonine-protein kinase HipA|uniref:type II toxin-antitoxin system HipA family toxin n=1 Tax=Sorangium sp. So ce327 TaxID=3133301 RepID=UPI003F615687
MGACLICLGESPPDDSGGRYHRACLRQLFGVEEAPRIDLDLLHLPARIEPEIGKMSISGMQRKALMRLSRDRSCLQVADANSRYILKPQLETYSHVPENEHASMRIAALTGMQVPHLGLFHLADGSLAYVIQRYDRTHHKKRSKLHQEDFCQLAGRPAHERGQGTAAECAALVARYCGEPDVELRRLYQHLLVTYWIGNGDLHLKNLSLLRGEDGVYRLAPAYDLICTWVYGDKTLALPLGIRNRDLRRHHWLDFAEQHARLPRAEAAAILDAMLGCTSEALTLLKRSPIPEELRKSYARLLKKRGRALE